MPPNRINVVDMNLARILADPVLMVEYRARLTTINTCVEYYFNRSTRIDGSPSIVPRQRWPRLAGLLMAYLSAPASRVTLAPAHYELVCGWLLDEAYLKLGLAGRDIAPEQSDLMLHLLNQPADELFAGLERNLRALLERQPEWCAIYFATEQRLETMLDGQGFEPTSADWQTVTHALKLTLVAWYASD